MRVVFLGVVAILGVLRFAGAASETPTPEPSLAEQAERATKNNKKKKPSAGKVLTNEDLKKAKGNVIFLQETPAPSGSPAEGNQDTSGGVSATRATQLQSQMDELGGRANRYRKAIADAQMEMPQASSDRRSALEMFIKDSEKELAKAEEAMTELEDKARREGIKVSRP